MSLQEETPAPPLATSPLTSLEFAPGTKAPWPQDDRVGAAPVERRWLPTATVSWTFKVPLPRSPLGGAPMTKPPAPPGLRAAPLVKAVEPLGVYQNSTSMPL